MAALTLCWREGQTLLGGSDNSPLSSSSSPITAGGTDALGGQRGGKDWSHVEVALGQVNATVLLGGWDDLRPQHNR